MRQPWTLTPEMFLSVRETQRLLAHVRESESGTSDREQLTATVDRLIVECMLFSGMRNSELCGLGVDDFVRKPPTLIVKNARGKLDRRIAIPAELAALINTYLRDIRPQFVARSTDKDAAFLLNERGRAYDRTALYRRVVRILSAASLQERASVQLLRHTYGYLAYLRTGGNLLFVQRQLGHAHPMVTAIYAQFVKEDDAELSNRIFQ